MKEQHATLGKVLERYERKVEGRPFILATISAPENLRQLERYRAIQKRLADPRKLSPQEAEGLIKEGKAVLLLTCNIHSNEVASAQTSLEFAYRLATDNSAYVVPGRTLGQKFASVAHRSLSWRNLNSLSGPLKWPVDWA